MQLLLLACLLLAVPPQEPDASSPVAASADAPLSVVLIVADDLGWGDLSCYGGSIPTPRLDALAASGTRFTQAYVTAPTCGPSRAGLLTGRMQQRFGFEFNTRPANIAANRKRGLPSGVPTLADRMRELGLTTGMIGKWHLGVLPDAHPLEHGFAEFFGFLGGQRSYLPGPATFQDNSPLLRGSAKVEEREYLTDAFAREAAASIERHAERPFFLYVAFNAPHKPYQASAAYLKRFPDLEGDARVYAAMVSALDDGVGRILDALDEAGLRERTLVAFLSDNGAVVEDGPGSNGPLRLGKFTLFEGGVRVPLIVRDPRAPGGATVEAVVSSLDLFPTLLRAACGDPDALEALEGRDLGPLLRAEAGGWPQPRELFWRTGDALAVRRGGDKLIRSGASAWLFDVADDPAEAHDVVDERAELTRALSDELSAWSRTLRDPLWPGAPIPLEASVHGKTYRARY